MGYKCEDCGANLDSGERCDCREDKETTAEKWQSMTHTEQDRQISLLPHIIGGFKYDF